MKGLRFDKLTQNQSMEEGKEYFVPSLSPKRVNCFRIKAGNLSFGWSDMEAEFYHSFNGARFYKIPSGTGKFRFPEFEKRLAGYCYGEVEWL
jgi:hypothetical protein